jgi:hypothetical protein
MTYENGDLVFCIVPCNLYDIKIKTPFSFININETCVILDYNFDTKTFVVLTSQCKVGLVVDDFFARYKEEKFTKNI